MAQSKSALVGGIVGTVVCVFLTAYGRKVTCNKERMLCYVRGTHWPDDYGAAFSHLIWVGALATVIFWWSLDGHLTLTVAERSTYEYQQTVKENSEGNLPYN